MTHDEIIKLVAYGKFQPEAAGWLIAYGIGAAAEREACAKIVEGRGWKGIAAQIRARGQE